MVQDEKEGSDEPPPFAAPRYEKDADESIHELYGRRDDAELPECLSPRELQADLRKSGRVIFRAELPG
jgi:hypothetical protein